MQNDKKRDFRKALYTVLAIAVATGIWLFADLTSNGSGTPRTCDREITDIPIEYYNQASLEEKGLMLLENGTDTTIDLTLSGTRALISWLDRSDIRVTVDLNKVENAGIQSVGYKVDFLDRRFWNNAITTKDTSIFNATVNISELYSRTVDIRCELRGNVADGFSAGQVELSSTSLQIQGQAEDIDPVSYAKVTFDIGENAEEAVQETLTVHFYDKDGNELTEGIHPEMETIEASLPVFVTKEVPLTIRFKDAPGARERNTEYEIRPKTIMVSGDAGKLKDVDTIVLDELDLLSLSPGPNTYSFAITVPEGCQNLSGVTRATVQISFRDMASAQVTTDRFRYESLPEGKDVDILTSESVVTIFGTAADVAAVTGEDITMVADLSDYGSALGTYTVPAKVELTTAGDVGISGSYEVQVTIRDPDQASEPDPDPEESNQTGE